MNRQYWVVLMLVFFILFAVCSQYAWVHDALALSSSSIRIPGGGQRRYRSSSLQEEVIRKAQTLMIQRNKLGLSSGSKYKKAKHYQITKFLLSLDHEVGYSFDYVQLPGKNESSSSSSSSMTWNAMASSRIQQGKKQRFICEIDMSNPTRQHFPHFAQAAFPCVSGILNAQTKLRKWENVNGREQQNLRNHHPSSSNVQVEYCLAINDPNYYYYDEILPSNIGNKTRKGGRDWIDGFIAAIEKQGILVFNKNHTPSMNLYYYGNNGDDEEDEYVWLVKPTDSHGRIRESAFPEERDDVIGSSKTPSKKYEMGNTKYFSKRSDLDWFQKAVLGEKDFHPGPSSSSSSSSSLDPLVRILIVDRVKISRHWIFSQKTKTLLESIWNRNDDNTKVLEIDIVSNPSGNLALQAKAFHQADLIISSHGAHLTNLAFIRPCTAVIELFPHGYYLGFFQPLVLAAEGLSYDGYMMDINPRHNFGLETYETRTKRRDAPLKASPESIEYAFPRILLDHLVCRDNWESRE